MNGSHNCRNARTKTSEWRCQRQRRERLDAKKLYLRMLLFYAGNHVLSHQRLFYVSLWHWLLFLGGNSLYHLLDKPCRRCLIFYFNHKTRSRAQQDGWDDYIIGWWELVKVEELLGFSVRVENGTTDCWTWNKPGKPFS